ncbi:hypothetical protein [Pseudonocardia sp. ICBG1142]|uniref:hypothetical protein n=1 Tax=Pseudonocardia sp. ICBG1142 TaxID=2846760 RepID=UPI001CF6ADC5|nr:hypothetical protein [Pseudonocardia sp. ICBG1142]
MHRDVAFPTGAELLAGPGGLGAAGAFGGRGELVVEQGVQPAEPVGLGGEFGLVRGART